MRARWGGAPLAEQDDGDSELEQQLLSRRAKHPSWSIDRGSCYFQQARERNKRPSLVETGRHAGRSRVQYGGVAWSQYARHVWKFDPYTTVVNASAWKTLLSFPLLYSALALLFALIYYATWRLYRECFIGFFTFQSAFMFSVETQATIGYGTRSVHMCWLPAHEVLAHSISALLLNTLYVGIIFAKLSTPRNRGRTILISDCATIARRNGTLKLMFRVGDMRARQVINPRIRAVLYTWGTCAPTSEGEQLPVRAQELAISNADATLLLPVIVEHTIDEHSPLHGHTQASLAAADAEIVVYFEGSTELGSFVACQSYLSGELFWGHVFANIISRAPPGGTRHAVDLARFHDVEPQAGLGLGTMQQLSSRVVAAPPSGAIPSQQLGENTLVLADTCTITPRGGGQRHLCFRVGDAYPGQMMNVQLRAYIYRWHVAATEEGEQAGCTCEALPLDQQEAVLRYPCVVSHVMGPGSPLAQWSSAQDMMADAEAEIVLVATASQYPSGAAAMRCMTYDVLRRVKWGHAFVPAVRPPSKAGLASIDWPSFHLTCPLSALAKPSATASISGGAGSSSAAAPVVVAANASVRSPARDVLQGQQQCPVWMAAQSLDQWMIGPATIRPPREYPGSDEPCGSGSGDGSAHAAQRQAGSTSDDSASTAGTSTRPARSNSWHDKRSLFDAIDALRAPADGVPAAAEQSADDDAQQTSAAAHVLFLQQQRPASPAWKP